MSMKTTVMAVAAMLMSAGVAAADATTDIEPQPSAFANGVAETFNAIKHATIDIHEQDGKDQKQIKILEKSLQKHIDELKAKHAQIRALQKQELNASVNAKTTANGDDAKVQQANDLKAASDDLKSADTELTTAETRLKGMLNQINGVVKITDETKRVQAWETTRKALQSSNEVVMETANKALAKIGNAEKTIAKYGGTSTSSSSEPTGAFKVTLKSFSCSQGKGEIYLGDAKVPNASKPGDSTGASADGKFTMHVLAIGPRREQARKYEKERAAGTSSTSNVEIKAASNWILEYGLKGGKHTEWKVASEQYEWKDPEGKTEVHHAVGASGNNVVSKTDQMEISFPTAAATNSVHGWVKGTVKWQGAQEEDETSDCQYEVTIAPSH